MGNLNPNSLAALIPRPLPSDAATRANVETVLQQGYAVIPNAFSSAEAEEAKAEIIRLSGRTPWTGRNGFEGHHTNRIFSLPNKSRIFDKFYICPQVMALNDYFLDPDYLLYVIQSIVINRGEGQQVVHHDDGALRQPRPRAPLSAAIVVALNDFTESNGATRIVPASHLWDQERRPVEKDTIPVVCPAGSIIYFLGTTYHSGGPNYSSAPRYALTVQYCQPYIRPLENLMLCVDPRKLSQIPEKVVDMMGYKTAFPFLGSGMSI
jgi:ectoine hydroxylase-related dioxygenase (phytanoyl-CoA dioxygenase family)